MFLKSKSGDFGPGIYTSMASDGINKKQITGNLDDNPNLRDLPVEIVKHIFHFLPTKDAVRTSVLSTKWKNFWICITRLHFDDKLIYWKRTSEKTHFVNFVNRVLLLATQDVESITFIFMHKYSQDQLNAWISDVLRRTVQKFHIFYPKNVSLYSSDLFNHDFLVELELRMGQCYFGVDSSVSIRYLQILKLSGITFQANFFSSQKDLVLKFRLLKVFEAEDCQWPDHVESVIMRAPRLESFSIEYPYKLAQSSNESRKPILKIFSLNLKKFSYLGFLQDSEQIILSKGAPVVYVSIQISALNRHKMLEKGVKASKFLKRFAKVEHMKLGSRVVQVLAYANDHTSIYLPRFQRLVCLEFGLCFPLPSQQLILNLLHKSPKLQKLVLYAKLGHFDEDILMAQDQMIPLCLLSSLKVVKINLSHKYQVGLHLIKYLLEKSLVLELLVVNLSMLKGDNYEINKVIQELFSYPKASSVLTIQVDFKERF